MTRWLNNLTIARKMVLVLVLMATSALGTAWYAVANLSSVNTRYSLLLQHEAGVVWLSRTNTSLIEAGQFLYKMIAETDGERMRAIQRDTHRVRQQVDERLAKAVRAMPEIERNAAAFSAAFQRATQAGSEVEAAALANDNDRAMRAMRAMRERYDPAATEARLLARESLERVDATTARASEDATANASAAWRNTVVASALGTGASIILALWVMTAGVSRPIGRIADRMRALATGDKESPIPGIGRRDEIGGMAEAAESFRQAALEQARMAAAAESEHAAKQARAQRVESLVHGFEAEAADALRVVVAAATELDTTAAAMQETAQDSTTRAASLAAASEQASANVATVAASAEEMAASIAEVARQVTESARIARQAAEDAKTTDGTMVGLTEAASRISDVVRLISGIAGQTNLLALNATIEAARAGEAGKGFAVVASEVKQLATQTTKATEEIGAQIAAIQAETSRSVEAIRGISHTIETLDGLTAQVAAAAEEQAKATQEIGRAVSEAAAGTHEVSRHATGVTDGAQQTGAASTQVRAASGELAQRAENLRAQMDAFLTGLRAA